MGRMKPSEWPDATKQQGDPLKFDKPTRTDMSCHNCSKQFVALLDYRENGNHICYCPHCGHEHFRVIKDGKITEERWNSQYGNIDDKERVGIRARRVWKVDGDVLAGRTSAVSDFLRQRWLEKMG